MKAADIRSSPRRSSYTPRFGQPKLPPQGVENALAIVFTLIILGMALSYALLTPRNAATPVVNPGVGLELVLSGAVTSTLSLDTDELKTVRCSPTGFHLESARATAFPLGLSFSGAPGGVSTNGAFYALGSRGDFTLKLNGTPYTLLSGTVTTSPRLHTFNASLVDAQSQPLQVSGRLVCP